MRTMDYPILSTVYSLTNDTATTTPSTTLDNVFQYEHEGTGTAQPTLPPRLRNYSSPTAYELGLSVGVIFIYIMFGYVVFTIVDNVCRRYHSNRRYEADFSEAQDRITFGYINRDNYSIHRYKTDDDLKDHLVTKVCVLVFAHFRNM